LREFSCSARNRRVQRPIVERQFAAVSAAAVWGSSLTSRPCRAAARRSWVPRSRRRPLTGEPRGRRRAVATDAPSRRSAASFLCGGRSPRGARRRDVEEHAYVQGRRRAHRVPQHLRAFKGGHKGMFFCKCLKALEVRLEQLWSNHIKSNQIK